MRRDSEYSQSLLAQPRRSVGSADKESSGEGLFRKRKKKVSTSKTLKEAWK